MGVCEGNMLMRFSARAPHTPNPDGQRYPPLKLPVGIVSGERTKDKIVGWILKHCRHKIYTTCPNECGHPFKLVDLAISATPVSHGLHIRAHRHAISIDKHWQ
jgi:hypothetical protein